MVRLYAGHRGVAYLLASLVTSVIVDTLIKLLGGIYPPVMVLFFRMAFGLLPLLVPLVASRGTLLVSRDGLIQATRVAATLGTVALWFAALPLLPLGTATAISFSTPIFITLIAVLALRERVGGRQLMALAIGGIGVTVVMGFDQIWGLGALLALGSAVLRAVEISLLRVVGAKDAPLTSVFYFTLAGAVATAALLPWNWIPPAPAHLPLLAAIGLLGTLNQYFLARAFTLAEVSHLAPFDYSRLVIAATLAFLVFGEVPTEKMLLGGLLIVGGTSQYLVSRSDHRQRKGR